MSLKKSYKILLLAAWYPSRVDRFAGDFIQRHAQAISMRNRVQVVYFEGDMVDENEIELKKLNPNFEEKIYYFPKSKWSIINFIRKSQLVYKTLRNEEYDLIHLNVMYLHFWPLLLQPKNWLITEHFTGLLEKNFKNLPVLQRILSKKLLSKTMTVTAVSKNLGDNIKKIKPKTEVVVIPNVVDTELFQPEIQRKPSIVRFLHLSNLSENKNLSGILKAIKILHESRSDFEFYIGGNGDITEIESFIEFHQLRSNVFLLPPLSYNEVAEQMKNADCFVLFSTDENQPCVIVEAFSAGLPVISSNVGGIAEFFPENFGYLIEDLEPKSLAKYLELFLEKGVPAQPQDMHEYAKANFSPDVISKQFHEVYQSLMD